MVAVRSIRPFSLDKKISNLDSYFPKDTFKGEVLLLSVQKNRRLGIITANLLKMVSPYFSLVIFIKFKVWPLFEVSLFSETRQFGDRTQTLSGIEFAITRSLEGLPRNGFRVFHLGKGRGLDLIIELSVGPGFRGFQAHTFNEAILSKLHPPTGNIHVLNVDEGEIKGYSPLGFSIQTQIGF